MSNPNAYQLLPFRFIRLDDRKYLVVNEAGEHLFLTREQFNDYVGYSLSPTSTAFLDLKSKHFLTDTELAPVIEMLAVKYRTKKAFLYGFTSLHMVVPTLRCNSNCIYCQVSKKDPTALGFDMDRRTAQRTVDMIFASPSSDIKIEFQGGEPLLNFGILKYIVRRARKLNRRYKKHLTFVICTNLTLVTPRILRFLRRYRISISTSLDGPFDLHNRNRPLQGGRPSYDSVTKNVALARRVLGPDAVTALMTTTRFNIDRFRDVVDEYVAQGFQYVFLRNLNPYGGARQEQKTIGYSTDEFVGRYKEALDHIIQLNIEGTYFVEAFAALLLQRILTPFSTGFVDLQSPSGTGIEGAVYDYNGNVYVSDEGRMLAAMGDDRFLLGNVNRNTHNEMFNGTSLRSLISHSCLESIPVCADCALQSYCGADPVRNYAEHGDVVCYGELNNTCRKCKPILLHLLGLIERKDPEIDRVFWSWIRRKQIPRGDQN